MTVFSPRLRLSTVYLGGFIGPFTGQAIAAILPSVSRTYGISVAQASMGITMYLAPFALTMLFSSALVKDLALHRVIRWAYVVITPAAVLQAFGQKWAVFLALCAVMGVCNAFTTPLFQIILKSVVPADRLGTALGTYAAMQSLGLLSAPLVAGFLAENFSWQYIYLIVAVLSGWVLLVGAPYASFSHRQSAQGERMRWGSTMVFLLTCFVIGLCVVGEGFMVALFVGDFFGLTPSAVGVVVALGGAAGFLFVRLIGRQADRRGPVPVLIVANVVGAFAMGVIPFAPVVAVAAAGWALAVLAGQGMQMSINMLVLRSPGGASLISTVQAFRFIGVAVAPVVFLPLYLSHPVAAFSMCCGALLVAALVNVGLARWGGVAVKQ
ncbi:MFS transporter [Corynebacterium aquilae]|uniref:Major facilitator superfamily (MFS) profile domain-containing protein n=1 Tax=Corynebacterium aquilae DSM 44791 TaxID=1431546 RepID=A0A1L7CGU1_9CORY|nr:MFS transporter [Corynebacterium aquilae]APT85044.1 hypothetical protein CAQU_08120 [Corynebacterium aquilae DSM 44791]